MTEPFHESGRLVLRESPGQPTVQRLAQERQWRLIGDTAGDPNLPYVHERIWQAADELVVHAIQDQSSQCCVVMVSGRNKPEVQALTADLELVLRPLTRAELLTPVSSWPDPPDRVRAIMRIGLASGPEFDREFFDRVNEYSRDPEPGVRDAAVWMTGYVDWPQYAPMLRRMAEQDPHEKVREDARTFLELHDKPENEAP